MIKRLSGPKTHICWTPDNKPENKRILVSLVSEKDLTTLEAENKRLIGALDKIVANEAIVVKGLSKILPSKIWLGVISESSDIATKAPQGEEK